MSENALNLKTASRIVLQAAKRKFDEACIECVRNQARTSLKSLRRTAGRWAVHSPLISSIHDQAVEHTDQVLTEPGRNQETPEPKIITWPALLEKPLRSESRTIREMHTPAEIDQNGTEMSHCIASYIRDCLLPTDPFHILRIDSPSGDCIATALFHERTQAGTVTLENVLGHRNRPVAPPTRRCAEQAARKMQAVCRGLSVEEIQKRQDQRDKSLVWLDQATTGTPQSRHVEVCWKWRLFRRILPEFPDIPKEYFTVQFPDPGEIPFFRVQDPQEA